MAKRKRRTLYLPMDYLPPGATLLWEYGQEVVILDERGKPLLWQTDNLRKVSRFYKSIVLTEKSPDG